MQNSLESVLFASEINQDWHMQFSERAALMYVLSRMRPDVSIEVGTFRCGSLRPIAASSRHAYTFDIDPNMHRASPLFSNVTFVTGDSAVTLPGIIDELNESDQDVNFVLIDGSHEEAGVKSDITQILRYKPKKKPTVILMHDSSNPAVRKGIIESPWSECPYVHGVDLDFVPGMLYDRSDIRGQIWGGLAAAVMLPEIRTGNLDMQGTFEYSRLALLENSIYVS